MYKTTQKGTAIPLFGPLFVAVKTILNIIISSLLHPFRTTIIDRATGDIISEK